MPHPGPAIVNDGFAARLALVYAALFLAVGWYLPLFPVWLSAQGLDPGAIGFVLAAFQFTRIVGDAGGHASVRPLRHAQRAASFSARWRPSWRSLVVGRASGFPAILAAAILYSLTTAPIMPLIDAYALKGLSQRALPYGPVRLWGSVAFIVATLTGGALLGLIARTDLIWLIFAGGCLVAAATLALVPLPRAEKAKAHASRAQPSAPAGVPRHRGGGLPDPGEPRGLLRLLDARLERQGFRRRHHRRPVGARRRGRDRAVRVRRRVCRSRSGP